MDFKKGTIYITEVLGIERFVPERDNVLVLHVDGDNVIIIIKDDLISEERYSKLLLLDWSNFSKENNDLSLLESTFIIKFKVIKSEVARFGENLVCANMETGVMFKMKFEEHE